MAKRKPAESVSGSYTPVPHALLESNSFLGASIRARAMLFEFMRQHNGRNNGRMQATAAWLKDRGWHSKEAIQLAVSELVERGILVVTKHGGLNIGPTLYGLTWLPITDFKGLELSQQSYWPGAWNTCTLPRTATTRRVKKREGLPDSRGSADPMAGAASRVTAPIAGAKTMFHGCFTAPVAGDNECCQLTTSNSSSLPQGTIAPSAAGWIAAELARLASVGLAGKQCFAIPPGLEVPRADVDHCRRQFAEDDWLEPRASTIGGEPTYWN